MALRTNGFINTIIFLSFWNAPNKLNIGKNERLKASTEEYYLINFLRML